MLSRPAAAHTGMSSRLLLQLLGFWLLLSQPCRARVSNEWMDEVIKVCGREYARAQVRICGVSVGRLALSAGEPAPRSRPATEIVPSSINKDAEPLDTMLQYLPNLSREPKAALSEGRPSVPELQQYAPALRDSVVSPEGFRKTFHKTPGEAEDNSPLGLKYLHLDTQSRRKRQSGASLSKQCCSSGCTRRSIAKLC